jgi:hypothetical protein
MKLRILIIILFIFFMSPCFGQKNNIETIPAAPNKNVIYGTLGVYPEEFYGTIMGNYERMIFHFPNSFFNSMWVRVGAGPWVWWTGKGINYVSTISVLTGRKGTHLETGAGVLFTYHPDIKKFYPLINNRYLAGNFGFRFQRPQGRFVFRTGIGWPEYLYLSLGASF